MLGGINDAADELALLEAVGTSLAVWLPAAIRIVLDAKPDEAPDIAASAALVAIVTVEMVVERSIDIRLDSISRVEDTDACGALSKAEVVASRLRRLRRIA